MCWKNLMRSACLGTLVVLVGWSRAILADLVAWFDLFKYTTVSSSSYISWANLLLVFSIVVFYLFCALLFFNFLMLSIICAAFLLLLDCISCALVVLHLFIFWIAGLNCCFKYGLPQYYNLSVSCCIYCTDVMNSLFGVYLWICASVVVMQQNFHRWWKQFALPVLVFSIFLLVEGLHV